MVSVYLMRHGETEANVDGILVGHGDSPFTELGKRQPIEVARHLDGTALSHVYTSPVDRALRTTEIVLETLAVSVPTEREPAIAEVEAGEFTGLSFVEIRSRIAGRGRVGPFRYPGGESWADVQDRAVEFVLSLERRHDGEAVLIVTHAGVIAGLVAHYHAEPIDRYIRVRFGHDFLGRLGIQNGSILSYEQIAGTVDRWY